MPFRIRINVPAENHKKKQKIKTINNQKDTASKLILYKSVNCLLYHRKISNITLKITRQEINTKKKNLPKIRNLDEIKEKIKKVNDNQIKSSLYNFLKVYNDKRK